MSKKLQKPTEGKEHHCPPGVEDKEWNGERYERNANQVREFAAHRPVLAPIVFEVLVNRWSLHQLVPERETDSYSLLYKFLREDVQLLRKLAIAGF